MGKRRLCKAQISREERPDPAATTTTGRGPLGSARMFCLIHGKMFVWLFLVCLCAPLPRGPFSRNWAFLSSKLPEKQHQHLGCETVGWGYFCSSHTSQTSSPHLVPVSPSLPRSALTPAHPEAGKRAGPLQNMANGMGRSEGRKVSGDGDGSGAAAGARGSPLFAFAAGGGTEAKPGAAEPPPRTNTFVQGSASARCFLPSLFADGAVGSDRLFRLGRGQSGTRVGAAALACIWGESAGSAQPRPWEKGEARAPPGRSIACGAPELG